MSLFQSSSSGVHHGNNLHLEAELGESTAQHMADFGLTLNLIKNSQSQAVLESQEEQTATVKPNTSIAFENEGSDQNRR